MFNASKFQLSTAISFEVRRVLAVQYKLFFSSDDFIKIIQIVSLAFGQLIQTRGQRSTLVPAAWFWGRRTACALDISIVFEYLIKLSECEQHKTSGIFLRKKYKINTYKLTFKRTTINDH